MLLDAFKFGNNNDDTDQMQVKMWKDINKAIREAGEVTDIDFLTVSCVNPSGWTARLIDLDRNIQEEIVERTF